MKAALLGAALLVAPARAAPPSPLTVAVAANMMPAMEELAKGFTASAGVEVRLTPGASGKLVAQIENGAPFDLFVSADMAFPEALAAKGQASGRPVRYAVGRLILWSLTDADVARGLASLRGPAVRKVAVADPKTAPYGRAAVAAMRASGLYAELEPKLVYGESLAQVNQFITSRAADAGFTARSIIETKEWKTRGAWLEIDPKLYPPIDQGLIVTARGAKENPAAASRLRDYILGPAGRAVLKRYGYALPAGS